MAGKVYLIGAGPGDPGLITVKGREVLAVCDAVVYDNLISKEVLVFVRPEAEKIFVGKQAGVYTLPQEEINQLLVDKAREGKIVARLKGGDPFIFGRGGEEAEAVVAAGLDWEVIPGVSSGHAVPAYAGIPLTHRLYGSTVAFVTGQKSTTQEKSEIAWEKIATGIDTLVFFMGVTSLPEIAENLIAHGRDPKTPVALIRWGTFPTQQTYIGTLETITEIVRERKLNPPAIIVVGKVVALAEKLSWFEEGKPQIPQINTDESGLC
jgi:uroporphyrin-III C-methyltransferase